MQSKYEALTHAGVFPVTFPFHPIGSRIHSAENQIVSFSTDCICLHNLRSRQLLAIGRISSRLFHSKYTNHSSSLHFVIDDVLFVQLPSSRNLQQEKLTHQPALMCVLTAKETSINGPTVAAVPSYLAFFSISHREFVLSVQIPFSVAGGAVTAADWLPSWKNVWFYSHNSNRLPHSHMDQQLATSGCLALGMASGLVALLQVTASSDPILLKYTALPESVYDLESTKTTDCPVRLFVINESCFHQANFSRNNISLECDVTLSVTCVKYLLPCHCLLIGYNSGAMQIFNISRLAVEHSEPDSHYPYPIVNVHACEADDDPRHFFYLWIARSVSASDLNLTGGLQLYQLCFEKRLRHPKHNNLFTGLTGVMLAMGISLPSLGVRLIASASLSLSRQSSTPSSVIKPRACSYFAWLDPPNEEDEDQTTVQIAFFDLNQWYHAQLPPRIQYNSMSVCSYYIAHSLVQPADIVNRNMALTVLENSVEPFQCWFQSPVPEPYLYPNALSCDVCLLSGWQFHRMRIRGQQSLLLHQLKDTVQDARAFDSLHVLALKMDLCGMFSSQFLSQQRHCPEWMVLLFAAHGLLPSSSFVHTLKMLLRQSDGATAAVINMDSLIVDIVAKLKAVLNDWNDILFLSDTAGELNHHQMIAVKSLLMQMQFLKKLFGQSEYRALLHHPDRVCNLVQMVHSYFLLIKLLLQFNLLPTCNNQLFNSHNATDSEHQRFERHSTMRHYLMEMLLEHCWQESQVGTRALSELFSTYATVVEHGQDGRFTALFSSAQAICQLCLVPGMSEQMRSAILLYTLADWMYIAQCSEEEVEKFGQIIRHEMNVDPDVIFLIRIAWMVDHEMWKKLYEVLCSEILKFPSLTLMPGFTAEIMRRVYIAAESFETAKLVLRKLYLCENVRQAVLCPSTTAAEGLEGFSPVVGVEKSASLWLRAAFCICAPLLESCHTARFVIKKPFSADASRVWMKFYTLLDKSQRWKDFLNIFLSEAEEEHLLAYFQTVRQCTRGLQLYYLLNNRVDKARKVAGIQGTSPQQQQRYSSRPDEELQFSIETMTVDNDSTLERLYDLFRQPGGTYAVLDPGDHWFQTHTRRSASMEEIPLYIGLKRKRPSTSGTTNAGSNQALTEMSSLNRSTDTASCFASILLTPSLKKSRFSVGEFATLPLSGVKQQDVRASILKVDHRHTPRPPLTVKFADHDQIEFFNTLDKPLSLREEDLTVDLDAEGAEDTSMSSLLANSDEEEAEASDIAGTQEESPLLDSDASTPEMLEACVETAEQEEEEEEAMDTVDNNDDIVVQSGSALIIDLDPGENVKEFCDENSDMEDKQNATTPERESPNNSEDNFDIQPELNSSPSNEFVLPEEVLEAMTESESQEQPTEAGMSIEQETLLIETQSNEDSNDNESLKSPAAIIISNEKQESPQILLSPEEPKDPDEEPELDVHPCPQHELNIIPENANLEVDCQTQDQEATAASFPSSTSHSSPLILELSPVVSAPLPVLEELVVDPGHSLFAIPEAIEEPMEEDSSEMPNRESEFSTQPISKDSPGSVAASEPGFGHQQYRLRSSSMRASSESLNAILPMSTPRRQLRSSRRQSFQTHSPESTTSEPVQPLSTPRTRRSRLSKSNSKPATQEILSVDDESHETTLLATEDSSEEPKTSSKRVKRYSRSLAEPVQTLPTRRLRSASISSSPSMSIVSEPIEDAAETPQVGKGRRKTIQRHSSALESSGGPSLRTLRSKKQSKHME